MPGGPVPGFWPGTNIHIGDGPADGSLIETRGHAGAPGVRSRRGRCDRRAAGLADRTGLPAAALLTIAGLVYAVLPGPNATLHPDVILTFVIPPLIYSAALNSSLLAVRKNLRVVISLSIGLVLATSLAVGAGIDLFVPGARPGRRGRPGRRRRPNRSGRSARRRRPGRALPARLITIIEGEGLLNDATALTILTVAVTAATSGGFSLGDAVLRFLAEAAGGLLAGVAVALVVRGLRSVVRDLRRRRGDPGRPGVTFGPIVRALGVRADPADAAALRNEARAAAAQAGLSRLDQITAELEVPGSALAGLRASLEGQLRRYQQGGSPDSAMGRDGRDRRGRRRDPAPPAGRDQEAVLDTRRAVIDAEREELLRWRDAYCLTRACAS